MSKISKITLVLIAVVAAVAAYVLTGTFLGSFPPVGFGWVTLVVIAVIDVLLALRVKNAISDNSVGQDRSQMHPLTIARSAALGQSSAILGAAATGVGAGLSLFFGLRLGDLAVAGEELPASLAVLVSGAVLVGAGLFLELACLTPPDDDDTGLENVGLAQPT